MISLAKRPPVYCVEVRSFDATCQCLPQNCFVQERSVRAKKPSRVIPSLTITTSSTPVYYSGMANLASPVGSGRIQLIGRFSNTSENTTFIPDAIITNKELGPGPKLVYSRLLSYAATHEAATNNRLAADLAVSPRSVRNYIAALKATGLVEVRHHPGKPRSFKLASAL